MVAPAVPEITEEHLHESIEARTDVLNGLRELGPPDLVHLVKQNSRNPGKQIGVYHHVTGVDASSSASLAAYINTLTYSHYDKTTTKIVEGIYCCYNAFSRYDMRVEVSIPGTVESYCIDEMGNKKTATDELWLETYLCSVLRAYSYADDGSGEVVKKIMGVRRFNPIMNTDTEHKFLQAAEHLFFRGYQLGSESIVQISNSVTNHLVTGLLRYFNTTGSYAAGINLFEKLRTRNVEVSSLLAKVLLMGNEEVQAIKVLHSAVLQSPMDYTSLETQADFLLKKAQSPTAPAEAKAERLKLALGCAERSIIAAPSEFTTWAKLAEVYVAMEDWENALEALNSCPMFTYQDRDMPIMPEPKDAFLPILAEARLDEIDGDAESRYGEQVHPSLMNLRASQYKGTFKMAYSILTEMTAKIGWDQLLRIRSNVFVMEEEYRSEKQVVPGDMSNRNPSTDVLRGTPDPTTNGDAEEGTEDGASTNDAQSTIENVNGGNESLEVPSHTVNPHEVKSGSEENGASDESMARFKSKRLCERWLDSLFMVLYEDLRIYTIWRTEMAQYRAQQMQYKKSAEEWEILGSLAERLHHQAEAVEAYRACLAIRFSPKALKGILNEYVREKNTRETVTAVIKLVTWQYRWYSEFSPELLYTIRTLIEDEGAMKVRSIIQASSMPQSVQDLTHHYAQLCAAFRSNGGE